MPSVLDTQEKEDTPWLMAIICVTLFLNRQHHPTTLSIGITKTLFRSTPVQFRPQHQPPTGLPLAIRDKEELRNLALERIYPVFRAPKSGADITPLELGFMYPVKLVLIISHL